tara:strand:+ start:178 stop:549 length:372 start_codon:yes stop_codon:yes gene_type:complete
MALTLKSSLFKDTIDFLSRVLISAIFFSALPSMFNDFKSLVGVISKKGIPDFIAPILLIMAIVFLILGLGFFIFSKEKNIGAILLLVFLIPTTLIFHISPLQENLLMRNMTIVGALSLSIIRK